MPLDRRSFLVQLCSGVAGITGVARAQALAERAAKAGILNPYEQAGPRETWLSGEVHTHVDRSPAAAQAYEFGEDAATIYQAA
jgi:hypothetical protein